jgi:DNA-binding NarL/FixJ family response regulator
MQYDSGNDHRGQGVTTSRSRRGRVLIVDDDAGVRALVVALIEQAGFEAQEAETGDDALRLAAAGEPPAVVLLDVVLPGLSGYEVCRRLRDEFGDALPIIFMSGERTHEYDRAAGMLLGADDYVVKPFDPGELLARIRRHAGRSRAAGEGVQLTAREHGVLRLLARGLDQQQIAAQLVISEKTVATHIQHLLAKLGAHSRAQAVAKAHREGLV